MIEPFTHSMMISSLKPEETPKTCPTNCVKSGQKRNPYPHSLLDFQSGPVLFDAFIPVRGSQFPSISRTQKMASLLQIVITYLHTCISTNQHTYKNTYTHTNICACKRTCIHTYFCACLLACLRTYRPVCFHAFIFHTHTYAHALRTCTWVCILPVCRYNHTDR